MTLLFGCNAAWLQPCPFGITGLKVTDLQEPNNKQVKTILERLDGLQGSQRVRPQMKMLKRCRDLVKGRREELESNKETNIFMYEK